jgi:hypothetical protein
MLHTSRIFNVNKHNMINKEEMKRRLWKAKVLKTWRNFGHENSGDEEYKFLPKTPKNDVICGKLSYHFLRSNFENRIMSMNILCSPVKLCF